MKALVDAFEMGVSRVGVNLCCGDVGVAEHDLDAAQIGAVTQEIGRERVAQGVRADFFGYAGFQGCFLDDSLDTSVA